MQVCPLCNGLFLPEHKCPRCGGTLADTGVVADYYDNYSPYLERRLFEDGYAGQDSGHCVHLLACPRCRYDARLVLALTRP